ncbi:hypothetical protein [Streptomyces sp. NPDC002516]
MAIATAVTGIAMAPAAQAQTVQNFKVAIQTSNGALGLLEPDGTVSNVSTTIVMDSEDSPVITPLPGPAFGWALAYRLSNGHLGTYSTTVGVPVTELDTVSRGTSPAISVNPGGGPLQTYFHSPESANLLMQNKPFHSVSTNVRIASSSSPASETNPSGSLTKAAAVADDHFLRQSTNGSPFSSEGVSVPVAINTSPSVAVSASDAAIAVNGGNGDLMVTRSSDHTVNDTGLAIKAGTSPSITAMTTGGFLTAYVSPDGTLNVLGPTGTNFPLGQKVADNSNPAIAADNHGNWKIAYVAENHFLSTYDYVAATNSNHVVHSSAIVKAATSPAIAAVTTSVGAPPTNPGTPAAKSN